MAEGSQDIILSVSGDTRQLEKDIQRVVSNANLNLNTKGFSQPLGKITGQLGEFEKSLAASNARVIAFGVSAGAIYAVQKAFSEMIKTTIQVEKSLAEINTILSVSQKELNSFGNNLFNLAKNTGQTFDVVAKSALEFSRQGLGMTETLKRTSDALILTRLSGLDVVSSTESITAALNSFNQTAITSNELINKLIAVDTGFAVSSADLAEAIKRVGSSAQDVGVSLDELIALVTSAQQITSRGGSVIGNSFKTIFTRLQRPEVLTALDELGVKTRDAEGNVMPLIQILSQLSTTFETLSGTQKSQIAELVGGIYQINILKAALGDLSKEYSIFGQALETSLGSTNEANKRNEQLNQTLSATLNKTLVNLTKSASDIGGLALGPVIQKSLNGLNSVLENFSIGGGETDGVGAKIGEGIARGLGNFLGGPGVALAVIGLTKVFERLTKYSADAFKSLSGLNSSSLQQSQIQAQVLNIISKNPQLIEQINKGTVNTASLHKEILSLIQQETMNMQKQLAIASNLAKALSAAGVGVAQGGPLKGMVVSNRTKAFGYIPNFNKDEEIEKISAAVGGYKAGSIKKTYIPKEGRVTYNSAESLVKYPGAIQPAILPPEHSEAGKSYKNNFIRKNGFDPYKASKNIPNFAYKNPDITGLGAILRQDANRGYQPSLRNKRYFGDPQSEFGRKYPDGVPQSMVAAKQATASFQAEKSGLKPELIIGDAQLLTLSQVKGKLGGYTFKEEPAANLPKIDVRFPMAGYRDANKKQKLEGKVKASLKKEVQRFTEELDVNPPLQPEEIEAAIGKTEGIFGSIGSQVGGIFEAGFRAAFGREVATDITKGTFDIGRVPEGLTKFFPGSKSGSSADFKSSDSGENRMDMALKILKSKNRDDLVKKIEQARFSRSERYSQKKTNKAFGYIPNFNAITDAIKREKEASGEKPDILWSDTLGTPVVVNNSQTAKYGKNADKIIKNDHINRGQFASKANLMLTGSGKEKYKNRIPNFAAPPPTWSSPGWENYDEMINAQNKPLAGKASRVDTELDKLLVNLIKANKNTEEVDKALKDVSTKFKATKTQADKISKNLETAAQSSQFQPPILSDNRFGTRVKDTLKSGFSDENLPEAVRKYKDKLLFASFGLSMLGGFASTLAGEDKKLAKSIDGFSQSVGTAATAMAYIPGHAGIAIGALVGAAGAINSLTSFLYDKGPEVQASLEKIKDENSNFANGTQKYSSVLQKLTEAYSNPKAKSSDLIKLNKELVEAAREIPSAYRLQLLAIQDNTKLQEEIAKIQKELISKQKGLEFAALTQTAIDGDLPDKFKRFYTEITKGIAGESQNIIQKLGGSIASSIPGAGSLKFNASILKSLGLEGLSGFDISSIIENQFQNMRSTLLTNNLKASSAAAGVVGSFSKDGIGKFEEAFKNQNLGNSLRSLSGQDFINKIQKDFGLDQNVAEAIRNLSPKDIERLREQIIKLGEDASKTAEVMKKTEKIREDLNKKITEEQKAIQRAKDSVDQFKASLDSLAKSAINFQSFQQKYNQQELANKNSLDIEKARTLVDYQKPFLNPFEEAKANSAIEELVRKQDFISEAQSIQSNANANLMKIGMDTLASLKGKTEDDKIQDALVDLSRINMNRTGKDVSSDIINTLSKLDKDFTSGDKEKLNTDLNSELDKQNQQLLELNQKNEQANQIAQAQLNMQKAIASRDVDRSAFGGQSALGIQDLMADRKNLVDQVRTDRKRYATYVDEFGTYGGTMGGGNTPGFKTGLYKMMFDQIGGFKPGEERESASIRSAMIDSRTSDIRYQAQTLKEALREQLNSYDQYGRRNGVRDFNVAERSIMDLLNKRSRDARNIASTQIDEALKTGKAAAALPLNIQGMAGDVKTITGLLQQISKNMDNTISSGIQQAIKDSISNYLNKNFAGAVTGGKEKINIAQAGADLTESIGKKKIDILNAQSSKAVNEAMLNEESMRTQGLKQNMMRANENLGKWIEAQVNKALSENKAIPSLEELESQEKSKGAKGQFKALDTLTKDTGSIEYQAFQQYIENVQKMQQLQEQIKGSIDTMNQKQQEIQQQITNELGKKGNELASEDKKPANLTPSGNIVHKDAYGRTTAVTGAPIPINQPQYRDSIPSLEAAIRKLMQIGPASAPKNLENNTSVDFNSLKQSMSDLSSALQSSANSQPENLNIDGNVNVSPLEVGGNLAISLSAPTFKVEIDDSDLQKTKAEIERSFNEKLDEMSSKILAEVQKGVTESLRQSIGRVSGREVPATTDNPFRRYGLGRRSLG